MSPRNLRRMYLFVDTEANSRARLRDAPAAYVWHWPRLVQIAWVLKDENGGELGAQSFIVRPDGFRVTKRIERERGITTDTALRRGYGIDEVLAALARDAAKAEAIVAHNIVYERRVIEAEFHRLRSPTSPFTGKKLHCTMRSSTALCGLTGGPFGYKWPKLQELHRTLFRADFDAPHDAQSDARACARCFFELKSRGVMDDEALFGEIYRLADSNRSFERFSRFVADIRKQFEDRGIGNGQRAALMRVRDALWNGKGKDATRAADRRSEVN